VNQELGGIAGLLDGHYRPPGRHPRCAAVPGAALGL
jgi:hypothetical protein